MLMMREPIEIKLDKLSEIAVRGQDSKGNNYNSKTPYEKARQLVDGRMHELLNLI
jgi:hypothetical protein